MISQRQIKVDCEKLASGKKDALGIHGHRVNDSIMSAEVEHEGTFRTFPLFDIVPTSRSRSEGILRRMDGKSPNRFFVMRQCNHGFASC